MKFYDRDSELEQLKRALTQSRNEGQLTVVMGRRRIGKTELVRHCGDRTMLYFFVARKTEALLCQDFVREAEEKLGISVGSPNSFADLFRFLLTQSKHHPFTLIIDEFQDLQKVNPAIFSEVQREWDAHKHTSHINLIVCGSVLALMKRIFEDVGEPLYGRADQSIMLQPFTTDVLKEILADNNPKYKAEDLLALYTISGGVAWYVSLMINCGHTTRRRMLGYLTEPNSPFINEGKNILVEEFGTDYAVHFSILSSIAEGMLTRSEIENQLKTENIGSYLTRLERYYGLVEKRLPLYAHENAKKVRYLLSDNFLTLWFRFFYKYQAYIESGALPQLARIIERDYDHFSGLALERYFEQKLRETGHYTHIGKFWDRKGVSEIDLIAVNEADNVAEIYEVKKDPRRYSEAALKSKVGVLLANCKELSKMQIKLGLLSLNDM